LLKNLDKIYFGADFAKHELLLLFKHYNELLLRQKPSRNSSSKTAAHQKN